MNILVITPYYYPNIVGGAEISSQLIAEGLATRGHEVTVLTIGEYEKKDHFNGVTVQTMFNKKMINTWRAVLNDRKLTTREKLLSNYATLLVDRREVVRLKDVLRRGQYDVAILNTNEECFQRASLWKSLFDLKINTILTLRDPLLLEKRISGIDLSGIYRKIIKRQMRWITKYAAPSQYMFNLYENNGFVFNQKRVIFNSVDINIIKDISEKDNYIIYAGGLVEKKGVKTLLKAFRELQRDYSEYKLYYIGRGELAEQLSREHNVIVIPWIGKEDLYKYIRKAKMLVLPSEWPEAFGRVIIEAVFNGTLAIGSDAGAIPEIFKEDKEYVYKEKDVLALSKAIKRIIQLSFTEYCAEVKKLQSKWFRFKSDYFISRWEEYINDNQIL